MISVPSGADVFRWPLIGPFLRWRHARTTLQLFLLAAAAVLILHGLLGPALGASNLATILAWTHYRGLLVIVLLAAGNFFCMGCPFVLARDTGRRFHAPWRHWPRALRTKWVGIALLVAVLFAYELFDLWALPRATAYLALAYFGAALAIDLMFSGATFCKYLCPIGQFNFVASTVSPLELRVREPDTCRSCRTVDCIKGRRSPEPPHVVLQRGCELRLFQPLKVGNLDCTFCMDCVQACPHDNVALAARMPAAELADPARRSGIGRLHLRPDLAALVVVFVFGGVANALGMSMSIHGIERGIAGAIGTTTEAWVLAAIFGLMLVAMPLILLGGAAGLTTILTGRTDAMTTVAVRYVYALVPFGFGVWLSHYGFHLLTAGLTVIPVTQRIAGDFAGSPILGDPRWSWTGLQPGTIFPFQLGLILLGSFGSLAIAYRISERDCPERPGPATAPWAVVIVLLAAMAIAILAQPMDMRGMGFTG